MNSLKFEQFFSIIITIMSTLDSSIETANSSNYNIAIVDTSMQSAINRELSHMWKVWGGTLKSLQGKVQKGFGFLKSKQRTHSSVDSKKRKPKRRISPQLRSLSYATPIKKQPLEAYDSPDLQQQLEMDPPKPRNVPKGTPLNPKNFAHARIRENTYISPYSKLNLDSNSQPNAASIARNLSHPKKTGSKMDVWNRLSQPKIYYLFYQSSKNQKKIGPKSNESKSLSKPIAVEISKKSKK